MMRIVHTGKHRSISTGNTTSYTFGERSFAASNLQGFPRP